MVVVVGGFGRVWRWGLSAAVVVGLVGVAAWAAIVDQKVGWTVVAASLAALVGAFAPTLFDLVRRPGGSGMALPDVAAGLAGMVLSRVRSSPVRGRLYRPMPMRVRFCSAAEVGASRAAVLGESGAQWRESPLVGQVGEVASRLRALPWRQLVVVGEPGAGKSVLAMMLVDQLLTDRRPGEPVPVLLGVSSWNPAAESVVQLVSRRLVEDFGLPAPVAQRLAAEPRTDTRGVAGWWVMPVLDGLDEIDVALHPAALAAVQRFAAADRPVVVTCRSREFQRAEAQAGVLARAAVVQLQPLRVDDVVEFLTDPSPHRQLLWQPVFDRMRGQPAGVLAAVLSSPLMAGLAKDTYTASDPGELVTLTTRAQIEQRLIDGYVTVAYQHPVEYVHGATARLRRYDADAAARWLASLAYLGYLDGTRDLRWWRLPWLQLAVRPQRLRWLQAAAVTALMITTVLLLAQCWWTWTYSLVVGAVVGLMLGMCAFGLFGNVFAHEFQPTPHPVTRRLRATRLAEHVVFGVVCGATAGLLAHGIVAGAVAGSVCGVLSAVIPSPRSRRTSGGPASTLRANHLLAAAATARHTTIAAAVFGTTGSLLGAGITQWALAGLAIFAAASLTSSQAAWLRFRLSHLVFALRIRPTHATQLPTRLIAFLNDGTHPDRATLRVNGNAWQFRHATIQDQLLHHPRLTITRRRADTGDPDAGVELATLLREQGNLDEATAVMLRHADAGNWHAHWELAGLLREQGNLDEAIAVMLRRVDAGDRYAGWVLAQLLGEQGNLDELRRRADAGDWSASDVLVELLHEQGNLDEAIAVLRPRTDAGHWHACEKLAKLLREQGNQDELRRRADTGDRSARWELAELLREQGNQDELRRRADAGDPDAGRELAGLLCEQWDLDEAIVVLRRHADAGNWHDDDGHVGVELARLLREQGNLDEAIAVLRPRADAGNWFARWELTGLLREQGNLDEAIAVVRRHHDGEARWELSRLLREQGNLDELRRRADTGDSRDREELAKLLREQGNLDELRRRTDAGDWHARRELARLLGEQGNLDEAIAVLRPLVAGDWHAHEMLAELLREQENLDELQRRGDAGD